MTLVERSIDEATAVAPDWLDETGDFSDESCAFDLAGFDPTDEPAFFNAVLIMETEGQLGGTDVSRAEIMRRFGIHDRNHWHTVKESVYTVLIRTHGSMDVVGQREIDWRLGQIQRQRGAAPVRGDNFAAVDGLTLETWAAINAAIVAGGNPSDLLLGIGITKPRWERASAEWNARMARDATFAIASVYGNAFQMTARGRFGDHAREAAAARASNRDLALPMPMSLEAYYEVMYEQRNALVQGRDPAEVLRLRGLSIVDWTDLAAYMGYFFQRTASRHWNEYEAVHRRVQAKFPGVR